MTRTGCIGMAVALLVSVASAEVVPTGTVEAYRSAELQRQAEILRQVYRSESEPVRKSVSEKLSSAKAKSAVEGNTPVSELNDAEKNEVAKAFIDLRTTKEGRDAILAANDKVSLDKTLKGAEGETFASDCEGYVETIDVGTSGTVSFTTSRKHRISIPPGDSCKQSLFLPLLTSSQGTKQPICVSAQDGVLKALNIGSAKAVIQTPFNGGRWGKPVINGSHLDAMPK